MTIFFFSIFMLIVVTMILPWAIHLQNDSRRDTKILARQRLEGLDLNLTLTLEGKKTRADIIMLNREFEQMSTNINPLQRQLYVTDSLRRFLVNDLDLASAIYISASGELYSVTNMNDIIVVNKESLVREDIRSKLRSGRMWLAQNSDEIILAPHNTKPSLSYIRSINSITDLDYLGVLILNVTKEHYGKLMQDYIGENSQVFLLDESGEIAAKTPNATIKDKDIPYYLLLKEESNIINNNGIKQIICQHQSRIAGYKLLSITTLTPGELLQNYSAMLIIISCVAAIIIFVGQFYISRLVSKPLAKMCKHMSLVESGKFVPIQIDDKDAQDEISRLKLFFNRMLEAIETLMVRIEDKERAKRKREIALIQEQMKPHFLYNALDAVVALTMIDGSQTAMTLTKALSGFYRSFLSGGSDIVPVRYELDCIKNYMTVLNIRYNNEIEVHYNVSSDILEFKMVKLILQPLIENAVYHGIRKRRGAKSIWITGYEEDNNIVFVIEDDGAGINQERIEEVLAKKSREGLRGFAIYSIIEKIKLYYDISDPICIENREGFGARVTVRIPLLEQPL